MFRPIRDALILMVFWIICFDIHRILFSIHHYSKLKDVGFGEWLLSFIYSFRLDLAAGAILSALPFLIRLLSYHISWKGMNTLFRASLILMLSILCLVQAGETVAYGEWNHKLTSRVFMHLSHPDEVARTANYGMIFWYIFYAIIQLILGIIISKRFFKKLEYPLPKMNWTTRLIIPVIYVFVSGLQFLAIRGGWQQIPLNINAATYSNHTVANDISINSLYFFGKSYLLYNRSNIDEFIPKVDKTLALTEVTKWYSFPKDSSQTVLTTDKPNVVVIVLEGWSAEAIGALSETKGATPNFDKLTKNGLLFSNIYSTSTTSEIGNSSIFSGNPAVPEVSISMQPEKHRKLHTINEQLEERGYHSSYIFSGDLKYGNIGGFFLDHGFDVVKDESDFPSDLPRGKLNFYDEDLYKFLIKEINTNKKPFLQCAFTGSTHAPYDQPKGKGKHFTGEEADYMNSLVYADNCLGKFIAQCKKQSWYKNTLFVFVADHGHASPTVIDPGVSKFYHIPLLFYGEVIKKEFRGVVNTSIGSQSDIAATLIQQMNGDVSQFPWSRDLLNPYAPKFAFHAIIRGYGWVSPTGNFTYHMDQQNIGDNSYSPADLKREQRNCAWFLNALYDDYKKL